jgi:hypothetical protein
MTSDNRKQADPGIFFVDGGQVTPRVTIRIDDDSNITADPITIKPTTDVYPILTEIAFDHVLASRESADALDHVKSGTG